MVTNVRSARILVVDDEGRNRSLLRAWLEATHEVVEAEDGPSSLAILEKEPIDLVLLDVMMPGMSGFEVCARIKERTAPELVPVLLLTSLHDLSDRKAGFAAGADDFLTKPLDRHELGLRVAAFLRIRHQERTIAAQLRELRQLDHLKDDLVSLIVHDLRNPLAAVMGLLELLQENAPDGELSDDVTAARHACNRLKEIVDDMLEARQLEEGKLVPSRAPTSVAWLVEEVRRAMAGNALARGVELVLSQPVDVEVALDHKLIRRALENLISNALRFSNRGQRVELRVHDAGDQVAIEVADRGPGVSARVRETLFDKFGAVRPGTDVGERRGHGLGLYSVKLAATAHGGAVSLDEREGGGSIFRITLPRPGAG